MKCAEPAQVLEVMSQPPCSGALPEAVGKGRAVNGLTIDGRRF